MIAVSVALSICNHVVAGKLYNLHSSDDILVSCVHENIANLKAALIFAGSYFGYFNMPTKSLYLVLVNIMHLQ